MKPVAFSIGYVVVVLMVHVSGEKLRLLSETIKTVNGPYHFSYFNYNEYILFEIILKNIPPSVTKIYLIYSGKAKFFDNDWTPEKLIVDKEVKNGEVTITFPKNTLYYRNIKIDVELETTEGLCTKSKVTEGRRDLDSDNYWNYSLQKYVYWNTNWNYDSSNFCRLPNICEIVVDFQNQCKEIFSCDYNATKYTCTLHHEKLDSSPTYNMFQNYYVNHNTSICSHNLTNEPRLNLRSGNHSPTNTKLIMELETFDNNTTVNVINSTDPNNILWFDKINLTSKDVVKDIIVGTLNYSESTDIQFSCEEYISRRKIINVYTVLYTKGNNIKLLYRSPKKIDINSIKMEDNGSILCCLYYSHEFTANGKYWQITRTVINKTLLIYQPKEPSTLEAQNSTDSKEMAMSSMQNHRWVLYVIAPVIGAAVLILALYFISKHGWCTKSQPVEEAVEMDNNTHQSPVLYADLDFAKNTNPRPQDQTEESLYANIVGELHPH